MQLGNVGHQLSKIIDSNVDRETRSWLHAKIDGIINDKSTRELYLTYSLIANKIKETGALNLPIDSSEVTDYLEIQQANIQQLTRIYLLISVLEADGDFFVPKVGNIIQVADTAELETFLKFLVLLPDAQNYKNAAVDALRTNITTVFNAIVLKNPYPALYFDEQQWNQMYLKAAFMQGDLSKISDIDKRANKELTRIISDYAHERWAASRDIDPYFWRPVTKFMDVILLKDMERLLKSDDPLENRAGALCCYYSDEPKARILLETYPEIWKQLENKSISWETLKD